MEFEKLQKIIAEVLNIDTDKITMESTFVDDLGADSLDAVELIMALEDVFQIIMGIEDTFDIQIPEDAAEHITTVAEAVEQIQAAKAQ